MHLVANRVGLIKELGFFLGITGKDPSGDLSHILIEAVPFNTLKLTATDRHLTLRSSSKVLAVEQPGQLSVNARQLSSVVKTLTGDEITLKANAFNKLIITSAKSKISISSFDLSITCPDDPAGYLVEIPSKILLELINNTSFAAAREEDSRYFIKGVLLEIKESEIQMAATDGSKVSVGRHIVDEEFLEELKILIPQSSLGEIKKLLSKGESIQIAEDDSHVFFRCQDSILMSNKTVGKFPAYQKVLDNGKNLCTTSFKLNSVEFSEIVNSILLAAEENSHVMKITLYSGKLSAMSSDPTKGEAYNEMGVDYAGPSISMGLNAKHVREWLHTVTSSNLEFAFKDATSGILASYSTDNCQYYYVANQLRI